MEMFREIIDFIGYIDYNKGIFLKKQTIFRRKRFGQRNSMFRRRDVAAHEEQQRRDTTMVTLQDIANQMGVSKSTVSKALNGASDISETLQKYFRNSYCYGIFKDPPGKDRRKEAVHPYGKY